MTHILTVAIEITLKKIEGIEGSDFFNKSNISTHLKSGRRSVFWANKPKLISVVPNPLSSLNSNQVDGPSVVVKTQLNATIKCGHPELTQPVGQVFRARGVWVPCIGLALGRLGKARAPTTQRRSC